MKLTAEQQLAVTLEGANILIAAGAGSGKTRVLVERIVRQIESGEASIRDYLVLTFTNAAASELKERIALALERSSNPEVRRQAGEIGTASIKTFHAFCADVCRSYSHDLEIDAGFKIAVDHEASLLLSRAAGAALEERFAAADPEFLDLALAFTADNNNDRLIEMVISLYDFSRSFVDPDGFLERTAAAYSRIPEEWKRDAADEYRRMLDEIDLSGQEEIAASLPAKAASKYAEYLASYRAYLEELRSGLRRDSAGKDDLRLPDPPRAPGLKKSEIGEEIAEELQSHRKKASELSDKAKKLRRLLARADEDCAVAAPLARALVDLTRRVALRYRAQKTRRNLVDYSDLEQYAIRLLSRDEIAAELRGNYRYIYIDEYQDSSAIQEHIIRRIAREDNLFMVGDIKQSIYKFRNAEPAIFAEKMASYARAQTVDEVRAAGRRDIKIVLGSNFRTRREIIETINRVFEVNMHGEIEFDDEAKLLAGAPYESRDDHYVEYRLLADSEDEPEAVAERIVSLIGTPVYDVRTGCFRPCAYRDIAVLHRSPRSVMTRYETAFAERGVPFYADSPEGFFQSLEVKLVHALMSVVDNPLRDVEWIASMRSPFFGFSVEEIARIGREPGSSYFARTKSYAETTGDPAAARMLEIIEELQRKSNLMPLDDLLWQSYEIGEFYAKVGRMRGGRQRQANLRQLAEIATSLRESDLIHLPGFLSILSEIRDSGGDYGTAKTLSEADDVVRFMSIHKSKGLEFPVTLIVGSSKRFNMRDAQGDLILSRDYGFAITPVDVGAQVKREFFLSMLAGIRNARAAEQEELRLLYVAMTRAMDRLIMFGLESRSDAGYSAWLGRCLTAAEYPVPSKPAESGEVPADARGLCAIGDAEIERRLAYRPPSGARVIGTFRASGARDLTLRMPRFEQSAEDLGARIGSAMHRVMERFVCSGASERELDAIVDASAREQHIDASLLPKEKVLAFVNSDLGRRIARADTVRKEANFVYFGESGKYQGIIDLYFVEDGEIVLVDYKTDSAENASPEKRAARHAEQIGIYAQALENLTGMRVKERYLAFLSDGVIHPV